MQTTKGGTLNEYWHKWFMYTVKVVIAIANAHTHTECIVGLVSLRWWPMKSTFAMRVNIYHNCHRRIGIYISMMK